MQSAMTKEQRESWAWTVQQAGFPDLADIIRRSTTLTPLNLGAVNGSTDTKGRTAEENAEDWKAFREAIAASKTTRDKIAGMATAYWAKRNAARP